MPILFQLHNICLNQSQSGLDITPYGAFVWYSILRVALNFILVVQFWDICLLAHTRFTLYAVVLPTAKRQSVYHSVPHSTVHVTCTFTTKMNAVASFHYMFG